jgi:DNA-binding transcriptional ArsR family regulator
MSNEAMNLARKIRGLESSEKFVLIILADYADQDLSCFPSVDRIMAETELSESTVRRALRVLQDRGLVSVEHRRRANGTQTSSRYALLMTEQPFTVTPCQPAPMTPKQPSPVTPRPAGRPVAVAPRQPVTATPLTTLEPPLRLEPSLKEPSPNARERMRIETLAFETFWNAYRHKKARPEAIRAFHNALKKTDLTTILEGVERYQRSRDWDRGYRAHPATWLNAERWCDEESADPVRAEPSKSDLNLDGIDRACIDLAAKYRREAESKNGKLLQGISHSRGEDHSETPLFANGFPEG